jgi:hypothetical protein
LWVQAIALQAPQNFVLKRFEVIRVNPDGMRRLPQSVRPIFLDPAPDGEPIHNLEDAARRLGFTPRLLSGKAPAQLFVTGPVSEEVKISVADLNAALREAKVENVTVPATWDGVVIRIDQRPGILADYGDFLFAQAASSTLSTPPGFRLEQFFEVLFRVMGINAPEARVLRDKFAAAPSAFFPIPTRYDMDIRQVPITSGPGLLLQNADKGGELIFMWSAGDRSYFLMGLINEDQAIAVGKSLQ